MNNQVSFIREKFDVMLIAVLFLVSFGFLMSNRNPDLNATLTNVNQAFIYALLALVGVRSGVRAIVGPVNNMDVTTNDAGDSGEGLKINADK